MAGDGDDLLNPADIEALLDSASAGPASPAAAPAEAPASAPAAANPDSTLLDPSEIEALLQQHGASAATGKKPAPQPAQARPTGPSARPSATERLLSQAEDDLAAALAPALDRGPRPAPQLDQAKPYAFHSFDSGPAQPGEMPLDALQDVELDLSIELGRTELLIEEVLQLREGSVVPLDKLAGDPVDIVVNGKLIARGEVLVLNDNLCVRVAEILSPDL